MLFGVVESLDIIELDKSVLCSCRIQLVESGLAQSSPSGIHLAHDRSNELVIADRSISVHVKLVEHSPDLALILANSIVLKASLELLEVKGAVPVFVHNSERTAHSLNAFCTARHYFVGDALTDFLVGFDVAWGLLVDYTFPQGWVRDNLGLHFFLFDPLGKVVLQYLLVSEGHSVEVVSVHLACVSVCFASDFDVLHAASQL